MLNKIILHFQSVKHVRRSRALLRLLASVTTLTFGVVSTVGCGSGAGGNNNSASITDTSSGGRSVKYGMATDNVTTVIMAGKSNGAADETINVTVPDGAKSLYVKVIDGDIALAKSTITLTSPESRSMETTQAVMNNGTVKTHGFAEIPLPSSRSVSPPQGGAEIGRASCR